MLIPSLLNLQGNLLHRNTRFTYESLFRNKECIRNQGKACALVLYLVGLHLFTSQVEDLDDRVNICIQ